LQEVKEKAREYLAGWQRAQADFTNFKRRAEQEREEYVKYANCNIITSILPVLDDFERAFAAIPDDQADAGWIEGIKLVERNLRSFLESQGVCEIKALQETFDPNLHEAVLQVAGEDGVVVQEVQKGYKLGDRVIRPSRVCVGCGETETEKEETEE
jgi:molecular chaperone GrpE